MGRHATKRLARLANLQRINAKRWKYDKDVNDKFGNFDKIRKNLKGVKLGQEGVGCLDYTCYNVGQMILWLCMFGSQQLNSYSDRDVSELVEAMAKFILRLLFENGHNGWRVYEKSTIPNRFAAFNPAEYRRRHGTGSIAICNWGTYSHEESDLLFNKKNYQLHVKRCRETSTVSKLLGVVAHEMAHEISMLTFKQYVSGNDHDEIWHQILQEIYHRLDVLQIPYVADTNGYDPTTRNH